MATKYWFANDYYQPLPQIQEANTLIKRPFSVVVNSNGGTLNGVSKVSSLATTGPDAIALCTIPGKGYGVCVTSYYLDMDKVDAGGGSAALVVKLGYVLTSTTNGTTTSSLDTGSTSSASDTYFATLITPGNNAIRMNPVGIETNASTPAEVACTYAVGALPLMITNLSGGNTGGNVTTQPNSGLYDLLLTVTTSANTLASSDTYIKGYIEYFTLGSPYQT